MAKNKTIIAPDFLIIPYQLIVDKTLQPLDRLVFAVIYWLAHLKKEKCIASNTTIAYLVQSTPRGVQNSLKRLEQGAYIVRTYKDTQRKVRKEIKCLISFKKVRTGDDRVRTGDDSRVRTGDDHNDKSINKNNKLYTTATQRVEDHIPNGIQKIFDVFYKGNNPAINFGNKTSRSAAEFLIRRFSLKNALRMAEFAVQESGKDFAPTVTTPYQLKEKLAALKIYSERSSNKKQSVVKIK